MAHANVLSRDDTVLLVVDLQEPFLRNVFNRNRILANSRLLLRASNILQIPVIATVQYREKMGDLVPEITAELPEGDERIDKLAFSCCGAQPFLDRLDETGRRSVLVCGVESHICVNQTVHDLLDRGYRVHLASDAISSRTEENYRIGIDKMQRSGAVVSSVETAVYELLQTAGTPEFKAILPLIK